MEKAVTNLVVEVPVKKERNILLAGQHLLPVKKEVKVRVGAKKPKDPKEVKNNETTKRAVNTDYKRRVE
jgi:hypothetical protein